MCAISRWLVIRRGYNERKPFVLSPYFVADIKNFFSILLQTFYSKNVARIVAARLVQE
jgi:hypothetical protein